MRAHPNNRLQFLTTILRLSVELIADNHSATHSNTQPVDSVIAIHTKMATVCDKRLRKLSFRAAINN